MSILIELIEEDYTLTGRGKFLKTKEHDSLVINVPEELFFWNSKGFGGNAYTYLTKVRGMEKRRARAYLKRIEKRGTVKDIFSTANKPKRVSPAYPKLAKLFWEHGKNHRDYWYKRGITDTTCDRFQLGYSNGWYLIPFYLNGELLNFQKRRDIPEKRVCSYYTGVGTLLFNADILKVASSVIITESPTDAIILSQFGYPAVSHNSGAEFWSLSWNKYFTEQKEIFVVYDNDEAGKSGAKKVASSLGEYRTKVFTFEGFPEKYDAGDWFLENSINTRDFGELLETEGRMIFE